MKTGFVIMGMVGLMIGSSALAEIYQCPSPGELVKNGQWSCPDGWTCTPDMAKPPKELKFQGVQLSSSDHGDKKTGTVCYSDALCFYGVGSGMRGTPAMYLIHNYKKPNEPIVVDNWGPSDGDLNCDSDPESCEYLTCEFQPNPNIS